ncbi:LutC/YkgG family protein [Oceanibaculum pacificum]|uniref:L-lactate dehydrogenase n=1 Tax=Oceanibaculum pacificum TaxID=580166 RepID=A0A154WGZ8_9PROT|nr:LUD domain-containing protein [Oceanibaculum pacificum]KZD12813.1 L-lactate dehydrogenase [Oceanibaculum pacificum]
MPDMSSRDQILAGIRRSLGRTKIEGEQAEALTRRLENSQPNLIPQRAQRPHADQVRLFVEMAEGVQTTVSRVASAADVPEAVADYLKQHNLPAELRLAPDEWLTGLPWARKKTLTIKTGRAEEPDAVSVTPAFAGVAETGTLMLTSGPGTPTTLNLLPETHMVVLKASQVVGAYEDGWKKLREAYPGQLPRTVNYITGPSRTGDIEQKILMGAHGPRRLHIVLIDD